LLSRAWSRRVDCPMKWVGQRHALSTAADRLVLGGSCP
jgi:hypothetical protein